MTVSPSAHKLRLNSLLLSTGPDAEGTGDEAGTWWWAVYGSDFSTGAAEPIEVTMRTLLQDGARVVTQGYGNREVTFFAVVGGVDSRALAAAEKQLALNLGRRGELGWTPADGWAPETVFDIETSSMTPGGPEDDDLIEVQRNERVYRLRFVCQPFVRSAEMVVVPAVSVPDAPLDEDVINAGTSLTGWTTRLGGVLVDRGSYLEVTNSRSPRAIFTPTSPVDLTTQPFISVVLGYEGGDLPYCFVNGVAADLVGTESAGIIAPPYDISARRFYFRTNETSLTKVEFAANFPYIFRLAFTDVRIRNLPPYSGTARQSRRAIAVDGSTRTQGALQLAAPEGQGLGTVLFYSTTDGVNAPSLRQYLIPDEDTNTPFADPDAVSGFLQFLGVPVGFDVPVSALAAGKTQIVARLAKPFGGGSTSNISWTAQTMVGETAVGPIVSGSADVTLDLFEFKVASLGSVDLPTVDLPVESNATIKVTLSGGHHFDEVWLLNLDVGAYTIVEAGDHQRVWIETATTARPRPAIYVGDAADRTDAFYDPLLVGAWGTHEFAPSITTVLVVTAGCDGPAVSFEFYPRFMNFVTGSS